jgi:hypothetical protein
MSTPLRIPRRLPHHHNPELYRRPPARPYLKLGLLALALFVVVALLRDAKHIHRVGDEEAARVPRELQRIIAEYKNQPVTDPRGFFQIVPPPGWSTVRLPASEPYNLIFRSPNGPDISIMATPTPYNDFPSLYRRLQQIEMEVAIEMNLELIRFNGRRAIQRTTRLHGIQVRTIDFVNRHVSHHIQFQAAPDVFDAYWKALQEVLSTYTPATPPPASAS